MYIDPGTGSYIFQIVMASLVGTMAAVALFWQRVVTFCRNVFDKKPR
jgi:hypothetical protein